MERQLIFKEFDLTQSSGRLRLRSFAYDRLVLDEMLYPEEEFQCLMSGYAVAFSA
jgi:hypothetical protein